MKKKFSITKEILRKFTTLWDSKSTSEIADELDISTTHVGYIASQLRQAGYDLPKKTRKGYLQELIKEFMAENPRKKSR